MPIFSIDFKGLYKRNKHKTNSKGTIKPTVVLLHSNPSSNPHITLLNHYYSHRKHINPFQ